MSTEAETAASLRQRAAELRDHAEQARTERATLLAQAEDKAQQAAEHARAQVREAAGRLWREASNADQAAGPLETRAALLEQAEQLQARVDGAEGQVIALAREVQDVASRLVGLAERAGQHGVARSETEQLLVAAVEAGDVDQVVEARNRIAAIDDVIADLGRQQQALRARQAAIGDVDGTGELNQAAAGWQRLKAQLRRVENQLDPERPEAVADRLADDLAVSLGAQMQNLYDAAGDARRGS